MIYFIQRITGGSIKIGTSSCMRQRLQELSYRTRATLKVLGVMDGGRVQEQDVHIKFHKFRTAGEWFNPEPELLAFIKDNTHYWNGLDEVPSNQSEYLTVVDASRLLRINRHWLHGAICGMASIGKAEEPIRVGQTWVVRRIDALNAGRPSSRRR